MKTSIIIGIVAIGLLVLATIAYFILPSGLIVPFGKVAVLVPVPDVDTTPGIPDIIFIGVTTVPLDLAKNQGVVNNIVVTFSEAMNPATVNEKTFVVTGPNNKNIVGVITSNDNTNKIWTFNPVEALKFDSVYNIMITMDAKGVSGNALVKNFLWSFTTSYTSSSNGGGGSNPPVTPPVTATPVLTSIALTPKSASLLVSGTKQLNATGKDQNGATIVATINYSSSNITVATVNSSGFATMLATGNTTITASSGSITNTSSITVLTSLAGCPAAAFGLANLGLAVNFSILSKSGITNIPTSVIVGNIGTSPITGASITGLACSELTGKVYDIDATFSDATCLITNATLLGTAISNMELAYTTANGLPACVTELGAGDIGGMTLAPGVYKWSTDLGITTDVTLAGNTSDVWVFQVAKGFSISNGIKVLLSGGAVAKNVFWVAAEGATLGTTSTVEGNILNLGSLATVNPIALNTGAVLNGRALSQKAVTLQANYVTIAN